MIIRGILDSSLNGQLCIRGFALIKELARVSKADYLYQRKSIAEQEEEIRAFLDTEPYLFFPEIILSYKIKHSFDDLKNNTPPLKKLLSSNKYKSSVDGTTLTLKSIDYKLSNDFSGRSKINIVELDLNDESLNEFIKNDEHPFHRIDGNHRLKAAELTRTPKVDRMVAPFCILLGEEFYERNKIQVNSDSANFDKSVKIFFHNINTKTIPLTSEENLKVIIDDKQNFPDKELEQILGLYAVKTRELILKVNPEIFTGIERVLSKNYRTYYNDIFYRLIEAGENPDGLVEKVLSSLKIIDVLYTEKKELKGNLSYGLLTSFIFYHVQGNSGKFDLFLSWVIQNNIFEIPETKADSIIRIFDKIYQKQHISIFVAMPYWSHEEVNDYNRLFGESLKEIQAKSKSDLHLELIPIMRFKGKSERIDQRLLESIKRCDIFVADITTCNPNVMYEVAFAEGSEKPMILIKEEKDEATPPFDADKLQYIPYSKATYYNSIKSIMNNNLKAILGEKFGIYFN